MSDLLHQFLVFELRDAWPSLTREDRVDAFRRLPREVADEFFSSLKALGQNDILRALPPPEKKSLFRTLAPDDIADVIQNATEEECPGLLELLDEPTRREVVALLAYGEDDAGGLMNPRFVRLRPDMTVDQAILYLRRQALHHVETIYYAYVLDRDQRLLGVASFRELFSAEGGKLVRDIMRTDTLTVTETMDQEEVAAFIANHDLLAVPVVDELGRMKGIVTVDDIVDVVQEEATEDMHKLGGMSALEAPYMRTSFLGMLRKRAGWLAVLFIGEMLTASAMSHYEEELARALVLALFVPLIISSGGNCGSQASTLVIRAMAIGEVRLGDWLRVLRREVAAGLGLGLFLAVIGLARVVAWEAMFQAYGDQWVMVAITVAVSLTGVVLWGTLCGSMLPFALRRVGFDPASASAPFVATLVDVMGLVIYFGTAQVVMGALGTGM